MEDLNITQAELVKLSSRQLFHGEYVATDSFRSIEKHAAVCFENGGLVAVTGKAGDRESQLYAAMFADAPAMLLEVARLRSTVETLSSALEEIAYGPFGKSAAVKRIARDALQSIATEEKQE